MFYTSAVQIRNLKGMMINGRKGDRRDRFNDIANTYYYFLCFITVYSFNNYDGH